MDYADGAQQPGSETMNCQCRSGSPDTCPECTDMETGEKFADQDKTEAQRLADAIDLFRDLCPTLRIAAHDPNAHPWQREVRQKLLERVYCFLAVAG